VDSAKLHDWLQVVGLFGVIGSLIFVGLQMKQDREIALSAATQARTETTIQNIMGVASNPYYMSAIDKIAKGDRDSLTTSERYNIRVQGTAALFNFENIHYQQQGFIPPQRWAATRETLKDLLRLPWGPREVYRMNPQSWRSSFQQVVNELLAEIDAEDAN
jgi:hypothetical protein